MGAYPTGSDAARCSLRSQPLMLLTAYPAMLWLVKDSSFSKLLGVELWLSFIYGSYNGAMVVYLTEIMPVDVRTTDSRLRIVSPQLSSWIYACDQHLPDSLHGEPRCSRLWLSFAAACGS